MSHNVTAQNGLNLNSTQQIAWHDGDRCKIAWKVSKKSKLFHEMLFLLQFSYKYTVRKKSVNGTSGPSQVSVSEIAAPYPLSSLKDQ